MLPALAIASSALAILSDDEDVSGLEEAFRRAVLTQDPGILTDAMFASAARLRLDVKDVARDLLFSIGRWVASADSLESMRDRLIFLNGWYRTFSPGRFSVDVRVPGKISPRRITYPYEIFSPSSDFVGSLAIPVNTFGGPDIALWPGETARNVTSSFLIRMRDDRFEVMSPEIGPRGGRLFSWSEDRILRVVPGASVVEDTAFIGNRYKQNQWEMDFVYDFDGIIRHLEVRLDPRRAREVFDGVVDPPRPKIVRQCNRCGARDDAPHQLSPDSMWARRHGGRCFGKKVEIPVYSAKDVNLAWRPENIKVMKDVEGEMAPYTIFRTTPAGFFNDVFYMVAYSSEDPYRGQSHTDETKSPSWNSPKDILDGTAKWVRWDSLPVGVRRFAWQIAVDDVDEEP